MKKLSAKEQKMMERLQTEYNKIYDRMGYLYDERSVAACNRELDRLNDKMMAILQAV